MDEGERSRGVQASHGESSPTTDFQRKPILWGEKHMHALIYEGVVGSITV